MFKRTMVKALQILQKAVIGCLYCYRYCVSPYLGQRCRFHPSCSVYALEALNQFGLSKGCYLAVRRLSHCHPFHPGGYDPLPK
jgi:putative membrane protein insertion efficiency factor